MPTRGRAARRRDWTQEIKYDGYRTQLALGQNEGRAFTSKGHDWSRQHAHLIAQARTVLGGRSAVIDGEMIVQDERGRSDFHRLRAAIHERSPALVFMAFELLSLDVKDLRRARSRKGESGWQLFGGNDPDCPIHFSAEVTGGCREFLARQP